MADPEFERFRPTSGRVTGVLGLVLGAAIAVGGLLADGYPRWVSVGGVLLMVLIWTALLRPRIRLSARELELRGMVETVTVPLAAVEEIAVRQVLAVRVGEKRYVSPALGRTRRTLVRSPRTQGLNSGDLLASTQLNSSHGAPASSAKVDDASFIEERIRGAVDQARSAAGVARSSEDQRALAAGVRREWAWPEIAALAVVGVAFVVAVVLR